MNFIHPSARVGADCEIGFGVVIEEGVALGTGCRIGHQAVIYCGTQIGDNCSIGAGAVLGKIPESAPTSINKSRADAPPLQIGEGCIIGAGAVVYRGATIGKKTMIADLSFVRDDTTIGDFVIIGTHVVVENKVSIGSYSKVQSGAYITAATTIGERCFIAPCVVTTNDNFMGRTQERFQTWGGPTIERGARVGADVVLLPNVRVGEEAFVAAGSIVTRDVPSKTQVLGAPAKSRREVPENEWADNQQQGASTRPAEKTPEGS